MLELGLACVYRGQGAEYGGQQAEYEAAEVIAKYPINPLFLFFRKKKKGMWSQKTCFLPGEYKRAVRDGKEIPTTLGKKERVLSMCAIQ